MDFDKERVFAVVPREPDETEVEPDQSWFPSLAFLAGQTFVRATIKAIHDKKDEDLCEQSEGWKEVKKMVNEVISLQYFSTNKGHP